jgi:hypothetical protein
MNVKSSLCNCLLGTLNILIMPQGLFYDPHLIFLLIHFFIFDGWNMFLGKIKIYFYLLNKVGVKQNNYYRRFII